MRLAEGRLRHSSGETVLHLQELRSVQEEIERLTKRVEEAEEVMLGASNLGRQLDRLEEQVQLLCEHVDLLTVQVATLEKVCFD
ncbi:hypothetical protein Bca52824_081538 [Brassica carinata]|uniref:Uncharacterized protein n=1 Tax=Brassica carinata TaxID=52824 RepID=A0A8X7TRC6_BRACI|nr:hypothetical protein Bca52824_081538 [Brassica carinata]